MIYGFLNQKGGCGKTTLATNVAAALAAEGHRVLLLDADPQQSAQAWARAREREATFPVLGMARPNLHKELRALAGQYDHILIDGPQGGTDIARSIALGANVIVIPVQPSPLDLWSSREVVRLIQDVSVFNETLISAFAINRKIANTAIGRDFASVVQEYRLPVLQQAIAQRVIYADAAAQGLSVAELDRTSPACAEIAALTAELLALGAQA